jgi:hypothetical protein
VSVAEMVAQVLVKSERKWQLSVHKLLLSLVYSDYSIASANISLVNSSTLAFEVYQHLSQHQPFLNPHIF